MFQQRYWGRNVYGNALREISKSTEGNFGWEEVLSLSFSLSLSFFFFCSLVGVFARGGDALPLSF